LIVSQLHNEEKILIEFSLMYWLLVLAVLSPIILGLILVGFQKPVRLVHAASGMVKDGYVGYSWTYLVFGWFVPVVRGELGIGVLHLVITLVSFGISQLIFPFLYNRQYMVRMLTNGWELDASDPNYELARRKLNIKSP
jgi:CHASE2 domain-containing sensor protein